jgi:hypothetical protein
MPDLPEIGYGTVHGRFVAGVLDSGDSGVAPDAVPLQGHVEFWPTTNTVLSRTSNAPATLLPQTVCVYLDNQGYLVDENGNRGVTLFATDDPDAIPTEWQWRAVFHFTLNDRAVPRHAFNFELPEGSDVDLTEVAPIFASDGIIVIKAGIPASLIDAKGDLIVGLADDTPVRLPVGPPGTVLMSDPAANVGVIWTSLGSGGWVPVPATEDQQGIAEIADQAQADAGTDDTTIITPLKLSQVIAAAIAGLPPIPPAPVQATEDIAGIAEVATQAEVDAGVDDLRFVTPAKLLPFVQDQIATATPPPPAQATEADDGITRYATQAEVDAGADLDSVVRPGTLAPYVTDQIAAQAPPPPQATEGVDGVTRYATQAEVDAGLEADSVVRPSTLAPYVADQIATQSPPPPAATELVAGIAQIADAAEAVAGTDDTTIMTPLKSKSAIDLAIAGIPVVDPATEVAAGVTRYATQTEVDAGLDADSVVRPSTLAPYVADQIATQSPAPAPASETVEGIARYATQAEVDAGVEASATVRPSTLAPYVAAAIAAIPAPTVPDASETVEGIARIATQAEVDAGLDDLTIVTPLKVDTAINAAIGALPPSIQADIFEAQGDLIVGTGPDAGVILPVGLPGQVMVPDPLAPSGVKWADLPPAGMKVYANLAEAEAVRTAEVGTLHVDDMAAAFPNLVGPGAGVDGYFANGPGDLVITTSVNDSSNPFPIGQWHVHQEFIVSKGAPTTARMDLNFRTFHRTFAYVPPDPGGVGCLWWPTPELPHPPTPQVVAYSWDGFNWGFAYARSIIDPPGTTGAASVVLRDTSTGRSEIVDPVNPLDIANKQYVDAAIAALRLQLGLA